MNIDTRNNILSIVLGIIIIALGYFLYHAIHDPYQKVIEQKQMTERVRYRMANVRDALVQFKNRKEHFPPTDHGLDSLVQFVKTDSMMQAIGDSLLKPMPPSTYNPDSLIYSPRPPHKRFEYTVNDTLRPEIYLLKDPDSNDKIGDLTNTTKLNAATWE